ncbi:hypothetical protein AAA536_07785 [Pseudomonas aeruginosa]
MKLKEQNSKNKGIIYSTSKFWSVAGKAVFKETISEHYGVEALTAKKALAYLVKHKAMCEGYIADMKDLPLERNWYGRKQTPRAIVKLNALRQNITNSMNKLNMLYEYELVVLNKRNSVNGPDYGVESFTAFKNRLDKEYKVKEITEDEFNRQNDIITKKSKIKKYNDIFFFWWFLCSLLISVTFESDIAEYLKDYSQESVALSTIAIVSALIWLPPKIMNKIIK